MKRIGKIGIFVGLILCMTTPLAACGGGGGTGRIDFQFTGEPALQKAFYAAIDDYNATQGKTDGIRVRAMPTPSSGNSGKLSSGMGSSSGADVAVSYDRYYKTYATKFSDLTGKVSSEIINDLYPEQEIRYHYNKENGTSNASDPLYALPIYNDPTVLYYNKTELTRLGVKCISVEESELDAFNNGAKDHNGKTKAEYGIPSDFNVPKKGFYREYPYVPSEGVYDGSEWSRYDKNELMIFNEKISCNWDEIEDIGLICTKSANSAANTQYGYYTEWWFNYGWSVGGDCLEDLSDGEGNWCFSLADKTPNYIVAEGKSYVGQYTGTTYVAGETLEIKDILNVSKTNEMSYSTQNSTDFYYTIDGQKAEVRSEIGDKVTDGTLQELPSIQQAFQRFCFLAGVGGLNVCPYPSVFNNTKSPIYFSDGKLAFLVEDYSNAASFTNQCKFEWGIARMPQYKRYTDPYEASCDTVAVKGKISSHSEGYCIGINSASKMQDESLKFIEWLLSDGQKHFADAGFASVRRSDRDYAEQKITDLGFTNASAIMDSMAGCKAGDWWYLFDNGWINNWAAPLNDQVRYGTLTFNQYIYSYIEVTNKALLNY